MGALETKKEMVAELTEKFKNAGTIVVVDYRGMTVAQATKMRKQLREAGVDYRVVKNTLLTIAAKEAGYTVKVYHGTNQMGFTIFDPKKSDDKISLFFSILFPFRHNYINYTCINLKKSPYSLNK